MFRSAIETRGLAARCDCEPLDEPIYVDREMWEKIVLNLVSNAFKFTFEGEIEVALRRAGAHVELAVRDTGIGIAANELPRLFERFHRVEGAKARTHEGSGIGLALVQELVRLHGGEIRAESVEGKGTVFTVKIPTGTAHLPRDRIVAARPRALTATSAGVFVEEALHWLPDATDSHARARTTSAGRASGRPLRGSSSSTTTRTCATTCAESSERAGWSRPRRTARPPSRRRGARHRISC